MVSYTRFIELMSMAHSLPRFKITGISFIDSIPLKVSHNIRIGRNKVFRGTAKRGEEFYGLVLWI